eukprot:CAMPEP_0195589320 /NCGR_PEP_ID=MMETSP0814-20130614/33577_1 /TAXON_ID=97485 /ORGANISM="Prymnesium parvum, Strain Texoma1" /LENGTH=53 /DNA_ID=CAMNT_0040728345 /DNA_START=299 /DNA_END=460 /DNA_ORIENTATION=-
MPPVNLSYCPIWLWNLSIPHLTDEVGDERDDDDKGDEEGGSNTPSRIDQSTLI